MDHKFSVVAIIAAYNERDIIGETVADLIRQGVSVYIIDNRSTDDTVAKVRPFEGRGVIGIETYPPQPPLEDRFEWSGLLKRKEALAQELDADWFIHHDADEFRESPWVDVDLCSAIQIVDRLGFNAIDFELFNFQLTGTGPRDGTDVRTALPYFEETPVFGKLQIRAWKKSAADLDLHSSGGHDARFSGRRVFPLRFILRHYPLRTEAQARRKVLIERIPRFSPVEREQGWHIQYEDESAASGRFTRETDGLTLYDPDSARRTLWLRPRIIDEALQAAELPPALSNPDQLRVEYAALRSRFEALQRDEARSRQSLDAALADNDRLKRALDEVELTSRLTEQHCSDLRVAVENQQRASTTLARRVAALESSWSWRVTAPARALARWLPL